MQKNVNIPFDKLIMKKIRLLISLAFMLLPVAVQAQSSREYIRNHIRQWGECRNVAITKTNGDLALYGTNGYASTGLPTGLTNAIKELRNDNEYIDDVQLTERGRWLILFGNNGVQWSDIPYSLERRLREYNSNGEVITSVTFNDNNEWVIVTTEHISASSDAIQQWIKRGMDEYGNVQTACITDDGLIVVFDGGYTFLGNIPSDLRSALSNTKLDVYRLKIAGNAWFFADKSGSYQYNM